MECTLCHPALGPIIAESRFWRLVLNRNQDLLGKCFLATRRHIEDIRDLEIDEWVALQEQLRDARHALDLAFRPDHVNYVFLQNQDRHVHMHIIPRYAAPRQFVGTAFTDPGYPGHYLIDAPARRLTPADEQSLAQLLGDCIDSEQRNGSQ